MLLREYEDDDSSQKWLGMVIRQDFQIWKFYNGYLSIFSCWWGSERKSNLGVGCFLQT